MAEQQLNAPPRALSVVHETTTGVIQVREHQPDRYTIAGNHLAQHAELSLTAIGLATYILSLPDGSQVDIRTLAERFPEGRDRITAALKELEEHGYRAAGPGAYAQRAAGDADVRLRRPRGSA
ncbi:helix-turn-helix domain-containing protein [Streptomyces sp. NPDC006208]|uniref:helix-turn-helix domain-containing protein n=1 Tax=Streptomyces sp. NPDC006208 TaxID=3156734 RepID=UPI0033BE1163